MYILKIFALFLTYCLSIVSGINAPKVTITVGSEDGSLKNNSRRGSIIRQVARDMDDTEGDSQENILIPNTNSTSETIIE